MAEHTPSLAPSAPLRILLVEDNPGDARLIREMLRGQEVYDVDLTVVTKLGEAMAALDEKKPDVALLDLGLPDSQGLETLSRFREVAGELPVVVLTGLEDEGMGLAAVGKGAQDYLVKGETYARLLTRALRYAVERQRLMRELGQLQQNAQRERELGSLERFSGPAQPDDLPIDQLLPEYATLVFEYVGAVLHQGDRPSQKVRAFAAKLAALRLGARGVTRLHVSVLNRIGTAQLPLTGERSFSANARFVLVEVMGHLLDNYRDALAVQKAQAP